MWDVGAGEWEGRLASTVPPVQVDRAQRNPPSIERTKRKEEKRREDETRKETGTLDANCTGSEQPAEGATRWQSGLIRREPLILSSNSKWKCPQLRPPNSIPPFCPPTPPNTQRRDNSNRQSLDCAVWIPLLAQLETLTALPYLSSPNFISPPTIKLRLPCCRRIASAVLSIDSRHLRPLKPPNLVGTSPSQRLPVIPSIVSPTPPPSLPPLTTWSRRRKPGPCPSSTPDSSKARPWFGHCPDRDLHLR